MHSSKASQCDQSATAKSGGYHLWAVQELLVLPFCSFDGHNTSAAADTKGPCLPYARFLNNKRFIFSIPFPQAANAFGYNSSRISANHQVPSTTAIPALHAWPLSPTTALMCNTHLPGSGIRWGRVLLFLVMCCYHRS